MINIKSKKTVISAIFFIICLFLASSVSAFEGINIVDYKVQNSNKTLYVGGSGPENYTKIMDAVENATDGDTVYVFGGVYYESLFIQNSIKLMGENNRFTIVDASRSEFAIKIDADDFEISGFTAQNASCSGLCVNGSNFTIHNNTFTKNGYLGISTRCCNKGVYENNTLKENERGFCLCWECYNVTVRNNLIDSNKDCGIYIYVSANNIVFGNTVTDNKCGIILSRTNNNTICKNTIKNCRRCNIHLFMSCNNKIICNNILKGTICALFYNCHNYWDGNYWNRPRLLNKPIFGFVKNKNIPIPSVEYDLNPAIVLN